MLVHNKNAAKDIINDIETEFYSTIYFLDSRLRGTSYREHKIIIIIGRRQPYLDPLNYIQVMLLKAHREIPDEDTVNLDPLLRTIHAIATGMRNTG